MSKAASEPAERGSPWAVPSLKVRGVLVYVPTKVTRLAHSPSTASSVTASDLAPLMIHPGIDYRAAASAENACGMPSTLLRRPGRLKVERAIGGVSHMVTFRTRVGLCVTWDSKCRCILCGTQSTEPAASAIRSRTYSLQMGSMMDWSCLCV